MKRILVIACLALLAGCATEVHQVASTSIMAPPPGTPVEVKHEIFVSITPTSNEDSNYRESLESMRSAITVKLKAALPGSHVTFTNDAIPPGEGTVVKVYINNFRYVSSGARLFVGIMAGRAVLAVNVKVTDLASGKVQADTNFDSESHLMQGIFGDNTPRQIEAMSDNIVGVVTGRPAPTAPAD